MVDLSEHTYMVRHNPNCPSPFEVRTGGGRAFLVDASERRNFVSYGKTLEEAMRRAAARIETTNDVSSRDHDNFLALI